MAKTPYHKINPTQDNYITDILRKGMEAGEIPMRTATARSWYQAQALKVSQADPATLMRSDPERFRQMVVPGRMYLFYYDPKLKKELPYYDRVPLIYPLQLHSDRFLGINLHYLSPIYRAKMMDVLLQVVNNNRYDETTRLLLNYKILTNISKIKYYKPAIKMYLKTHVRSRFISIAASEWSIAAFLPLARFEKAPQTKVWSDSTQMINFGK